MGVDFSRMDIEPALDEEKAQTSANGGAEKAVTEDDWEDDFEKSSFIAPDVSTVIFSVGNAGGNIIKYMGTSGVCRNVKYVMTDTDYAALNTKKMPNCKRILIGEKTCKGFGAGMHPEVAEAAALETEDKIRATLKGVKLMLLIAGEGGGTGTGAAPVVARIAKEEGAIVIAMVTKPFRFEGKVVMNRAINGINNLKKEVDAIEVIDNQKVHFVAEENIPAIAKFHKIDEFHGNMVAGFINVIKDTSTINLDFNDVKMMLEECKGNMFIGVGESSYNTADQTSDWDYGEKAMMDAVERAISCPLIDGVNLSNAKGIIALYRIGEDISLEVLEKAQEKVNAATDEENANIIYGVNFDRNMNGKVEVLLVIAGLNDNMDDDSITDPISTMPNWSKHVKPMDMFEEVKSKEETVQEEEKPATHLINHRSIRDVFESDVEKAAPALETRVEKNVMPDNKKSGSIYGFGNDKKSEKDAGKSNIPSIHGFTEIPSFLRRQCQ